MSMSIKNFLSFLVFIFLLSVSGVGFTSAHNVNLLRLKALFLYNFSNFAQWPGDAFVSARSPIRMCLYGDVKFHKYLEVMNGTLIGNRELVITQTNQLSEVVEGCQILFVDESNRIALADLWRDIKYLYVLSVGEREGFADAGGIINIMRTTDNVQFDVNISNAMANGLFISSDLLTLAREIKRNTSLRK